MSTLLLLNRKPGRRFRAVRKDAPEPPRETPLAEPSAPPSVPTATDYRRILERSRLRQLELTRDNLRRLAATYDRAAQAVVARVRALPANVERTGVGWLRAQYDLLQNIDAELVRLRKEYGGLLDLSMLSSAQAMADREAEVARLVGYPTQVSLFPEFTQGMTLATGAEVSVSYGRLAVSAVERVTTRYYSDGLKLSDRLYSLDREMRNAIENALVEGVATGASARDIAKTLEGTLLEAGAKNPRMRAQVIAQTEINHALRESAVSATKQPDGSLKPYISAVGWRLSASHKLLDRCDLYASDDTGLGAGNYLPGDVPVSHPRCLCAVLSILAAFPEEQFVRKEPDATGVPEKEVRRLLEKENDPVAARWLAGRTTA